jgi:predicted Zn finger-like uncharacterized protein
MRIECPACAAAYDVPDHLMKVGRAVKCARCGESWMPVPLAPEPDAVEEPAWEPDPAPAAALPAAGPTVTAMDRLAARPARRPVPPGLRLAWAGSIAVLIAGVAGMYVWRQEMMRVWPPSIRLYAVFGTNAKHIAPEGDTLHAPGPAPAQQHKDQHAVH